MKIQKKINLICLKKIMKWLLIMLFISIAYLLTIKFVKKIEYNDILMLLGGIDKNNIGYFGILIVIYHYSLTTYYSYLFYNYELEGDTCNILLRVNSKDWIKSKFLIQTITILIIRLVYCVIIYLIIPFDLSKWFPIVLEIISIHLLLSVIVVFLCNNFKRNIIYAFTVITFLLFEIFNNELTIINLIICGMLAIYSFLTFNFKSSKYVNF